MRKLKIMTWNIHQQGRQYNKNRRSQDAEIPLSIITQIPEDVRVVVFTEFNSHAQNALEFYLGLNKEGFSYSTTTYSCAWANDVLIAVRGKDIKIKSTSYVKAYSDIPNTTFNIDWDSIPENLRLDIQVDDKDIHIWGVRIKDLKSDYEKRKIEMETIMHWLEEIKDITILLGDFNNAKHYGKLEENFESVEPEYWRYSWDEKNKCYIRKNGKIVKEKRAHYNYNLHRIKDALSEKGFQLCEKEDDWTFKDIYDNKIHEDHIFVKGLTYNSSGIDKSNLSDHNILWAEVELKD